MSIYRGSGGSGDATSDATVNEVTELVQDALGYKNEAATSASNAATSASNAATSESNASTSETNASTAASGAATSETNAGTSATNAATSATSASTSASNASASATSASSSASSATSSASSAASSASTATTKASEASTSASNAATSETNASTSETNAASSATSASSSASSATTSATNAATSATNAGTSATNAANSATAAAASAVTAASFTPSQTGNAGKFLTTNGTVTSWDDVTGGGGDVVDDTTPQLGGDLDLNSNDITGTGNISLAGTSTTTPSITLTTTEDSSNAAPIIELKRNSASPADGDYLGQLKFVGENDADQEVIYAKITGKTSDVTDGTEDGLIEFAVKENGSNTIVARITKDSLNLINSTDLEVDGTVTATSFSGDGSSLTGLPAGYADSDVLTLFNAGGSAPVYACRAWVNFNGTGTVAIRDSGNVSSVTDRGTGRYTVNLTTSMADSDYATIGSAQNSTEGSPRNAMVRAFNSSSYYISIENHQSTYTDAAYISSCVFE